MDSGTISYHNGSIGPNQDYFAGLYEHRPIEVFAVTLSVASSLIYIPLFSVIILYIKFGSDQKQTILTKLYSSGSFCAIHWFLVVQIPESIRYIFGPLPTWFCYYHFILKNAITIQMLLYSDAITILRFLFIFKLKNPSGFSDSFWTRFLNVWIAAFSYLSQFLLALQPGRQPLNFFICSGLDPSNDKNSFRKVNVVLLAVPPVSILIHLVVRFKIFTFKWKPKPKPNPMFRGLQETKLKKEFLADFALNMMLVFMFSSAIVNFVIVNDLNPSEVSVYPNYLFIYYLHIFGPFLQTGIGLTMYYMTNEAMRTWLVRELKLKLAANFTYFRKN